MSLIRVFGWLVLFVLTGCAAESSEKSSETDSVAFSVLTEGGNVNDENKSFEVITDSIAFSNSYTLYTGEAPATEIDFSQNQVVIINTGWQGSGESMEVERVERFNDHIKLHVNTVKPGADCVAAAILILPQYQMVQVHSAEELVVRETLVRTDCSS